MSPTINAMESPINGLWWRRWVCKLDRKTNKMVKPTYRDEIEKIEVNFCMMTLVQFNEFVRF